MKNKPIRMCILCKDRLEKNKLLRLQYINQEIINYTYESRSFYLCYKCTNDNNRLYGRVKKMFKQSNIKLKFTIN